MFCLGGGGGILRDLKFGGKNKTKNTGGKCDLRLALRIHLFEYLRETWYNHALDHLDSASLEPNIGWGDIFS